jgi:hypothetical protein
MARKKFSALVAQTRPNIADQKPCNDCPNFMTFQLVGDGYGA